MIGDDSEIDELKVRKDERNISLALPIIYQWLLEGQRDPANYSINLTDSYIYKTIMSKVNSDLEGRSVALRLFLHYVADVHQPLHALSRYTKENPSGDRGGNTMRLKNHYTVSNLHSLWDTSVYTFYKSFTRPFSK